ncbi:MAG: DNA polymerase III subunit delta [Lachnospiraceae bacterium]|jgi:DNA polymerase-3 subunit delta|nr:DNA polymerase III subunit delta [Lachnospiraceae bacterium]
MKSLNSDLKSGELKQIYLLYGAESYLRRQYRDKIKQALIGPEDRMNYNYYEGKKLLVTEFIDLAETMPFFAEHRLIIWENSGLFKNPEEKIVDYIKTVPATTRLVFVEAEVDKRGRLFKLLTSMGGAVECPEQDEDGLKRWVAGILKREGMRITERNVAFLLSKTGFDMENIRMELEKLIFFCLSIDTVTEQDIEAICTTRISNHIFDMVNAIADKRQGEALRLYNDLLTLKEPPMRILFLIARQFNILLQVKELREKGYDNKVIGSKVGLAGFIAGKYVTQAAKFPVSGLREAVEACVEAEEAVKTGRIQDNISVELLIINYSR